MASDSKVPSSGSSFQPQTFSSNVRKSGDRPCPTGSSADASLGSKCLLHICPSTGGEFSLHFNLSDRVDHLKAVIGQRLRIQKERILLLFRDRTLDSGCLADHGVVADSKITLLPTVHTGLKSQRPEFSMVQALENLSDGQVNDFIGGRSPLTLAMRMGEHMMFVQLQLSSSPPPSSSSSPSVPLRVSKKSYSSSASSTPPSSPESSPAPFSPSLESSTPSPVSPSSTCPSPTAPRFAFPPPSSLTSEPCPRRAPVCVLRGAAGSPPAAALEKAKRSLSLKLSEFSRQTANCAATTAAQPQRTETGAVPPSPSSSAIIESMQHLGHGVYSGTFSGTLNPQLQDLDGKPKRSINTIIHILNDLLGASPQCAAGLEARRRRPGARSPLPSGPPASHSPGKRPRPCDDDELEENQLMRTKVEQLQMMLEQRKLKRRKMAAASKEPAEEQEEVVLS